MGGFAGWDLHLRLVAVGLGMQGVLWLLARGLGQRLRWEVVAAGWLLPLLVLWPWLSGAALLLPAQSLAPQVPGTYHLERPDPWGEQHDVVALFIPWELEVRHALAARRLPFWSDRIDGGASPWANLQAEALSPTAMLARALPIQHHLLAALALKILVACQGAWIAARRLGARRPPALLAGAGFALGGAVAGWGLFPLSSVAAWSPWLLAGAVSLARHPRARALAATSVAVAAVVLAGHPEVALGAGLLAVVLSLALLRRRGAGRALGALVLAAVLGCALAAPVLAPFFSLVPRSQRAHEHGRARVVEGDAVLRQPASWFQYGQGDYLAAPTNPQAFGRPYRDPFEGSIAWVLSETPYVGLLAFAGLGLALGGRSRRRAQVVLLAFAAVGLLLAAGFLPFVRVLFALPIVRLPEYARLLSAASLALALAGALGWDAFLRRRSGGAAAVAWLVLGAAISLHVEPRLEVAALWLLLAAGALAAARGRRAVALAVLGATMVLDLVSWARWMLPRGDPHLFFPATEAVATMARETAAPGGPWRVVGHDLLAYPAVLSVYGLEDVRPHNPLAPHDQIVALAAAFEFLPATRSYFSRFSNLEHPLLDFLNTRVVVSNRYLPPIPGMVEIGVAGAVDRIYRNPDALPRWFLPVAADRVPRAQLARWVDGLRDPRRVALVTEEEREPSDPAASEWMRGSPAWDPAAVRATRAQPGAIDLELAPAPGARLVATSIPGPWGWRARHDRRELRTVAVNGGFLGVIVPARASRVTLRFVPPGFWLGCAVAAAAAVGLAGVAWGRRPGSGRGRSET